MSNNNNNRGRYQPYRGASTGRGRGGGGGGGGRGRGRGMGERQEGGDHHSSGKPSGGGPGHLVPVKPTIPSPASTMTWRVLYAVPPNSRPEVGPSGERIPGPFSPPLRPSTPEQPITGFRKPQDELRKENETFVMKQRVQQLLQQAANSPSGGMGTYVGKLSQNNNSLIPVLPRFDN
ncbi:hypothetical protein COEREDRAFT_84590 [Coemansia reversa NRRL 1564]|uniref:Uncharacterized protein n=1 Tax=Coemansia reversa (strain ATCC 12441 / NRRL 1564) TaxID=763665 RepID=A0A2G5BJV2_COERN|nr:hypothetical protein COEREDRAFT_84590 [Coemansia reversa NRRL 1564]|eukprot:PIA19288.1 hypothetical protein COEREDRAFT_84590 [Coemansia reversa NRRL 1564]